MKRESAPPDSCVVLRLGSAGDVVLTEPVVATLRERWPDAEIGFVVKERFRDLVAGNRAITRIHALREGRAGALVELLREVRRAGYSVAVDLHATPRSRLIAATSRARVVTTYRKRDLADTLRVRLLRRPFRTQTTIVDRYLASLARLGIDVAGRTPRFHLASADSERARAYLARVMVPAERYAVVVPGAVWPTKRWPLDRYCALGRRLSSELGLRVLVLGGPGERAFALDVAARAPGAVAAAGDTSLAETAALISTAAVYVGNDSGPTHMAAALGVPTVAIFGPTDPAQFDFRGHRVLYADLPCSACSFFGSTRCRFGHLACMTSISVDQAFAAVQQVLRAREAS